MKPLSQRGLPNSIVMCALKHELAAGYGYNVASPAPFIWQMHCHPY